MNRNLRHTLIFVLLTYALQSQASTDLRPDLMVAAGDSITAAFIANTHASDENNTVSTADLRPPLSKMPKPLNLEDLFDDIDSGVEPSSMEYDDGSETKTYKAVVGLEHKKSLSWSTGESIPSHYQRLSQVLQKQDRSLRYINVARTGSRTKDLSFQADQIEYAWNTGKYRSIAYVTLLIGANDACMDAFPGGTPANKFASELRQFFARLAALETGERIRVLVAGLPRIPDVGFEPFQTHSLTNRFTCAAIQNTTKLCPALVNWKSRKQYWANVGVVLEKNAVLKHIAEESTRKYPNLDIVYSDAMFGSDIEVKQLAKDCFHPNALGQTRIAQILWDAQPWFK